MGKREFLEILSERLIEALPREVVINHLRYYEEYINGELQKGKSLSEVMIELGDPLMIAHTIINTETGESYRGDAEDAEFVEIPKEDFEQKDSVYQEEFYEEKNIEYTHLHTENEEEYRAKEQKPQDMDIRKNSRIGCLAAAVVITVLLVGILLCVGSLISVFLPVLLPIAVLAIISSFLFGKR